MVSGTETSVDDRTFKPVPAAPATLTRAEQAEEHSVEVTAVLTAYVSALLFSNKGEDGNAVVGTKDLVEDWDDPNLVVTDKDGKLMGYRTTKLDPEAKLVEVGGELIPVRRDKAAKQTAKSEVERRRELLATWMAKTTETSVGISADFIEIMQK